MRTCGGCGASVRLGTDCACAAETSGPKQAYSDECDHEYDEDEDALEFVCTRCGDREPIPLDRLIRD